MEARRLEGRMGGCWEVVCVCPRCGDALGLVIADGGEAMTEEAALAEARGEAGDACWLRGKDGRLVCPACREWPRSPHARAG